MNNFMSVTVQIKSVTLLMFDWLMETLHMMDEWRYAPMGYGDQYVPTIGMLMTLKWCVNNWVMMDVSDFYCYNARSV